MCLVAYGGFATATIRIVFSIGHIRIQYIPKPSCICTARQPLPKAANEGDKNFYLSGGLIVFQEPMQTGYMELLSTALSKEGIQKFSELSGDQRCPISMSGKSPLS